MDPKFSVLLPTHNRADVVGFAIGSVLRQTEPDFELLVVGDGCTDDTASVVRSFGDHRIRWFDYPKSPNLGYANRNRALREARGQLIAFIAHDDLLLPDHLAELARCFGDDTVEWAYSRPVFVADDGFIVPFAVDLRKDADFDRFMRYGNTIPASCVIYRRHCHQSYGYWPEDAPYAGDYQFWKSIIGPSQGANVAYLGNATTLHFRAQWRTGREWGPQPLPIWLEKARRGWWPSRLRLQMTSGISPQAHFHRLIEDSRDDWTRDLRSAVGEAMDELAWAAGLEMSRRIVRLAQATQRIVERLRGHRQMRT